MEQNNYQRIRKAIEFLNQNFKTQPSLDEVAEAINLSPFHFQKLFTEWAGVSPKKFLQFISLNHAKSLLQGNQNTLFDVAHETGLSGTGRLHDLFVNIEGMTPGEFKNGGEKLNINYSYAFTSFGKILTAATTKGLCYMGFEDEDGMSLLDLKRRFPKANLIPANDGFQDDALSIYAGDWSNLQEVKLHLKGTAFQLKVWEALLQIPSGHLSTYGALANAIDKPKASRAIGTAIGSNPVAFLIPCHRVIQSSGAIGGYMWGSARKKAIIGWEAAQQESGFTTAV